MSEDVAAELSAELAVLSEDVEALSAVADVAVLSAAFADELVELEHAEIVTAASTAINDADRIGRMGSSKRSSVIGSEVSLPLRGIRRW